MSLFDTPTMFVNDSIALASTTMANGLGRDEWASSFAHFTDPGVLEQALTPEGVALYAERQFGGWQRRQQITAESHSDAQQRYEALPSGVRDFIKSINLAKLASLAAYVSQDGIRALIEIGKNGGSISDITHLQGPEGYPEIQVRDADGALTTRSPIHVAMLEMHHDVWLNINGKNHREHPFCLENFQLRSNAYFSVPTQEFPFGMGNHSYHADGVQVDRDAATLASMPEEFQELLIQLADPGDGIHFFRTNASLAVRDPNLPVLSPCSGTEFTTRSSGDTLKTLVGVLIQGNFVTQWYTAGQSLDGLQIPAEERPILKELLYQEDGTLKSNEELRRIGNAIHALDENLRASGRSIDETEPQELQQLIERELQGG